MNFLQAGCGERTKAAYHGVAFTLFAGMCLYNGAAFLDREECEPHLLVNTLLYLVLMGVEGRKVAKHLL